MLTVKSAGFYENFAPRPNGTIVFTGRYDELYFDEYPVTADVNTFGIDFHATGNIDGYHFIRVHLGNQIIHESALTGIHARDAGGGGDFGFTLNIQSVTFPSPGLYVFDFVFNDSVLHSVPLNLIETKKKKRKPRS